MREHEPRPALSAPNIVARQAVRAHLDLVNTIPVDASDEEIFAPIVRSIVKFHFEEKEGGPPLRMKPVGVVLDELDYLILRPAELLEIFYLKRVENLLESAILDHFIDLKRSLRCGRTRDIRTPIDEVGVDATMEQILHLETLV